MKLFINKNIIILSLILIILSCSTFNNITRIDNSCLRKCPYICASFIQQIKIEMKRTYVPPQVNVTRMILENSIALQCSPINHYGIRVNEWEDGEEQAAGDGDIYISF